MTFYHNSFVQSQLDWVAPQIKLLLFSPLDNFYEVFENIL